MKKAMIVLALVLVVGVMYYAVETNAQMGRGMMGPGMMGQSGYQGGHCPYCGQYMGPGGGYTMGPGMMGRGIGPGMMHHGWGMGPGIMGHGMMGQGYGQQYGQSQEPLKEKDAKSIVENYIKATRNPNLKVGKMKDAGNVFEAEILTKDKSLVDKVFVDKYSGWMRSVY